VADTNTPRPVRRHLLGTLCDAGLHDWQPPLARYSPPGEPPPTHVCADCGKVPVMIRTYLDSFDPDNPDGLRVECYEHVPDPAESARIKAFVADGNALWAAYHAAMDRRG
jgi:hypothetical protein